MPLPPTERGKLVLSLSTASDYIAWALNGADWVTVTMLWGASVSWPAGAVVTAEYSTDGGLWWQGFASPVTWTSTAAKDRLRVSGATHFRLKTTTTAGSTDSVVPIVDSFRERP